MQKTFYSKVCEVHDKISWVNESGYDKFKVLLELENLLIEKKVESVDQCGIVSKDKVTSILESLLPKPRVYSDYYQEVKMKCPLLTKIWFR